MPTPTKKSFTISTDFPNGKVSSDALKAEIEKKGFATALHTGPQISTAGDNCDVWFADVLSAADETKLHGDATPPAVGSVIGDHQGVALAPDPTEIKFGPSHPTTSRGKPIFLSAIFRGDVDIWFCGAGDDPAGNKAEGQVFEHTSAAAGDSTYTWTFNDWIYLAGGTVLYSGAKIGDWVDYKLYAPQTPAPTLASPANTGNCNLTDVGGFNLITPAAGDGTHDVDLANAILVSATAEDGYYDWDEPDTGKGTITASATPGAAKYNLFDAQIDLARIVAHVRLLGSGEFKMQISVKPKKCLPHWKHKAIVHSSGTHTLEVCWDLTCARKKST